MYSVFCSPSSSGASMTVWCVGLSVACSAPTGIVKFCTFPARGSSIAQEVGHIVFSCCCRWASGRVVLLARVHMKRPAPRALCHHRRPGGGPSRTQQAHTHLALCRVPCATRSWRLSSPLVHRGLGLGLCVLLSITSMFGGATGL